MTDETTSTGEGPIEFPYDWPGLKGGPRPCVLQVKRKASGITRDATTVDIVAALAANPELRAAVLCQLPEFETDAEKKLVDLCQELRGELAASDRARDAAEEQWQRLEGEACDRARKAESELAEAKTNRDGWKDMAERRSAQLAAERARVRSAEAHLKMVLQSVCRECCEPAHKCAWGERRKAHALLLADTAQPPAPPAAVELQKDSTSPDGSTRKDEQPNAGVGESAGSLTVLPGAPSQTADGPCNVESDASTGVPPIHGDSVGLRAAVGEQPALVAGAQYHCLHGCGRDVSEPMVCDACFEAQMGREPAADPPQRAEVAVGDSFQERLIANSSEAVAVAREGLKLYERIANALDRLAPAPAEGKR
jgi:hypothetical protein